jgi:predicted flap endonuclease-1-like 5' DNA nuclease
VPINRSATSEQSKETMMANDPSKANSPAKGKPASPDALAKSRKPGDIELSEDDLKRVSGGGTKGTFKDDKT